MIRHMEDKTTILNRLLKNHKKLRKWLSQNQIEAYRLYDKDIPQYPFIVDIYKDNAIIFEKGKRLEESAENLEKIKNHRTNIIDAVSECLSIPIENIYLKIREKKKGKDQYEIVDSENNLLTVMENGCKFKINLTDYLDSGLFLDHRPIREIIKKEAKKKSFLNLFCYTGSVSVAAAMGGASVKSVDMSKTYLNWAKDNFRLNNLTIDAHEWLHSDVFTYLKEESQSFDLIFCDPPSFSNSKRMEGSFDVQRDHAGLVRLCMNRLKKGGVLYFSNNLRTFKLDESIQNAFNVKDISLKSIPKDFTDLKIHKCFKIEEK